VSEEVSAELIFFYTVLGDDIMLGM